MEIIGELKVISVTQSVSEKFKKRDFVVTIDQGTPYPQHIQLQVTQDKCSVLDNFTVGQDVRVQFNLRGREWNGPEGLKYFNTLEAWKIEKAN